MLRGAIFNLKAVQLNIDYMRQQNILSFVVSLPTLAAGAWDLGLVEQPVEQRAERVCIF